MKNKKVTSFEHYLRTQHAYMTNPNVSTINKVGQGFFLGLTAILTVPIMTIGSAVERATGGGSDESAVEADVQYIKQNGSFPSKKPEHNPHAVRDPSSYNFDGPSR